MSPEVLAAVSDKERKRQEAIFELLTSERHYVDSLKLVKEVFFDPMIQEEVLTEEEMAKVCTISAPYLQHTHTHTHIGGVCKVPVLLCMIGL